ncbi:MAG TPA: YfhO family protein, partial [Caldilineaceae bacterium]|nr:YfhO family protein [Caldilineaceae bacterium]
LGLLLALGRWNPLYFVLYTLVPGFDLFRTPARWMLLYTVGMAVLAGLGMEVVQKKMWGVERFGRMKMWPRSALASLLLLIVGAELLLAARALPHTHPTAPGAVDEIRTAPAHLLTDPMRTTLSPAAMGRFLGMSTITYDPGDLADWRRILLETPPAQLDQAAFDQFVIALKVQELLVPNLALLRRVPTVDGFDGGVLPLQRYNEFLRLFVPPAELVGDGRLREQIRETPATQLLNLVNGQYLITDKVRDLWFEGIFYDRQIGARLHPGLETVTVEAPQPFAATQVDLIGYVDGPPAALQALAGQNSQVARVNIHGEDASAAFTLSAGGQPGADLADGALDSPLAQSGGATVAYRDVEGRRQEYRVRLALPAPLTPRQITIERLSTPLDVVVQAVTLVDGRTGMFTPLLPSDRGRYRLVHSGDVKIYENLDLTPRATLVHEVIGVETPAAALAALESGQTRAGAAAVVEGLSSFQTTANAADSASILAYAAERVVIRTRTSEQALLVLRDSAYPGWRATIDGVATPIYTTDYLFRGVVAPPGEHEITFVYQPASWVWGLWLSAAGLLAAGLLLVVEWRQRSRPQTG